ncbi:hypothetical protein RR48_01304 [Papilio machaon]|uniref:Uncharacterized protein n=1 Tax=Papilio machaon TaxID=76193 RepID=A0A0N0PFM8_PAPMA|nr:hypothetical protein RR48_01304 [Papilio machaon]
MNPHNNKYKESDLSETSMDQDSEASLIIIPDSEDSRNTLYSTNVDEIYSNSGGILNYTKVIPEKRNCKSTETSFIEDNLTEDYSNYSTELSKTLSDNIFYSNEIIEPYPQTFSVRPANLGDQLTVRNVLNTNVLKGENSSNLTIDLTDNDQTHTIVPYLCGNSSRNSSHSTNNYQSSCKSKKQEESNACVDKTKAKVCEGSTKPSQPKSCKICNDSNMSFETKQICASIFSSTSVASKRHVPGSAISQDTKDICRGSARCSNKGAAAEVKHSCTTIDSTRCCATMLRAPKCDPDALKPPPKKERKASCCSIAPQAKKSLSDLQKCPYSDEIHKPSETDSQIKCPFRDRSNTKFSNNQNNQSEYQKCPFRDGSKSNSNKPSHSNKCPFRNDSKSNSPDNLNTPAGFEKCPFRDDSKSKHSICQNKSCAAYSTSSDRRDSTNVSAEKVMSCTGSEEKRKECKNKPRYCSNTMILSESVTMMEDRFSVLNLDKCPSKINIENMQYSYTESQGQPSSNAMEEETLSAHNLLTESQRNINAYYGFNSKPTNVQNCMKIKVIPSTAHLTNSELSVIKTKGDRNETIPTCKITSDDFTSMAKGFFGCIYAKTKDATTYITRESFRLLDAANHKTQSCNTDDTLTPVKVCEDKSIETPLSYLMRNNGLPLAMVDQGTSKNEKRKRGTKLGDESPHASFSTVNLCSCSRKYKSPDFSNIAVQEPPQQINSVFTAIKSKIFSIFRDDDTATGSCKSKNSKSSSLSVNSNDSYENETVESMLPKRN